MIFRGQSDASLPLIPSSFRNDGRISNYASQPPPSPGEGPSAKAELGYQLVSEVYAVRSFLEHADRLGIQTPLDYEATRESVDLYLAALSENDYDYSERFPATRFENAVALAQHFRVPTRFLDWTESPLVACFFAAFGASSFSNTPSANQSIGVMFMSTIPLEKSDSSYRIVQAPRFGNSNIRAQQGLFITIDNANEHYLEHRKWPEMESSSKMQIQIATLPTSQADSLLRLLFKFSITRHSMMPSLENASLAFQYTKTLFG